MKYLDSTEVRKLEHIEIVLNEDVQSRDSNLLENVRLVHNPLPNNDLNKVDLHKDFCGFELDAPLIITGITGGHIEAEKINESIAKVVNKFNIGMGVGSQRAGIENPSLAHSFSIVRERAPDKFIIGNIGVAQFNKGYDIKEVERAIEMIKANAIAIHVNPGQEAYQDEGDVNFSSLINKIEELSEKVSVPIIIKEVGNGLNKEIVSELRSIGIKCFDVAGLGGTNWIKAEMQRSRKKHGYSLKEPGKLADYWGNPTAISVIEARFASEDAYIIGSGGIRDGLDAAKIISLGADVAGMAFPILKILKINGEEGLEKYIQQILYQIKTSIFLSGGNKVASLWKNNVTIWGRLREELLSRGINPNEFLNRRLYTLAWRYRKNGI
ncbi:MAG: type 2 isopentenyl-diphosphate Delta-isomerase [Caldisphaera sp.]